MKFPSKLRIAKYPKINTEITVVISIEIMVPSKSRKYTNGTDITKDIKVNRN